MLRQHSKKYISYNNQNFEKSWKELKDIISIGIYVNSFLKKDKIQEIWDISEILRLKRVRVIEENAVRIKNTP